MKNTEHIYMYNIFYLKEDALKLQEAIEYDDEGATHFSSVDDEYKYAGVEDPKVFYFP